MKNGKKLFKKNTDYKECHPERPLRLLGAEARLPARQGSRGSLVMLCASTLFGLQASGSFDSSRVLGIRSR